MNKKILILAILGLMTPLVANAWFNSFGTAGGVDQVIRAGQQSGAIGNQPGDNGPGPDPGPLTISNVSYTPAKDQGNYLYIDVTFKTNKSVTKIGATWKSVNWAGVDCWKEIATSGTSHNLLIKYVEPNTNTLFTITAWAGSENVSTPQYSTAASNTQQRVYRVFLDKGAGQISPQWRYYITTPPDNFAAKYRKNGGTWYSFTISRTGNRYITNWASSVVSGDVIEIEIQNPDVFCSESFTLDGTHSFYCP